jgi:hypothetical protein
MSTNLTTDQIADKIRSSALLVSLQLGSYNPVKTDKSESRKVSSSHGINDPKLMKVQKHTLPTAGVLEDISKLDTKIRAVVNKYTAPFARGINLLPAIKFFDLRKEVNALFDERAVLVKKLADEYSIYLDGAKRSLNGAFKDDDYPPVTDVVSRFYAKLDSFAIANPQDTRLGVLGEIAEQIQAAQAETLNDKLSTIVPYLRELLLSALCHQSAVLQNPDAKLYETTFTNVLEAAEQVDHLNMLGDEQINNAVFAIRDRLNRTKDQVKDDDQMRKMLLSDCNNIIESLDGTIPQPIESKGTGKAKKAKKAKAPILCDVLPPPPAEIIVPELAEEPEEEQPKTTISSATSLPDEVTETPSPSGFDADAMLAKLGW